MFWASHVVHHSSQYFNLSTALRQTWVPMTYFPFWMPIALLGYQPWMILTMQAVSLMYQFWIHTERIGKLPRPIEFVFNTPVAPPRAPRRQRHLPRPQLRRHPDHLGPDVRHLPGRGGAGAVRAHEEHPHLQPVQGRVPRVPGDVARRERGADNWRDRLGYVFGGPAWQPGDGAAGSRTTSRRRPGRRRPATHRRACSRTGAIRPLAGRPARERVPGIELFDAHTHIGAERP